MQVTVDEVKIYGNLIGEMMKSIAGCNQKQLIWTARISIEDNINESLI